MSIIDVLNNFDDLAETVADPPPNRPFAKAVGEFGQFVCDRYSAAPASFLTDAISPWDDICAPYWENQGYDPPTRDIPFEGGQCAGVSYLVTWSITETLCTTGPVDRPQANKTVVGPIARAKTEINPGSNPTVQFRFGTAGSTLPIQGSGSYISPCFANVTSALDWGNFTVTRVDGLPDNCGDPDGPIIPGPNPAPNPGPLPPDTGPSIDIRGNPTLVLPPNIFVSPTANVGVEIGEINLGGGGAGGGPPSEPLPGDDIPGEGSEEGGGETDFPEPPDGERWVGCCISLTSTPPGLGIIPQSIPQDVYPEVVGNARLRFGVGSVVGHDTPIQLRSKTVCLWEPVRGLQPKGVFVNLKPGFSYTVKPYSVPIED